MNAFDVFEKPAVLVLLIVGAVVALALLTAWQNRRYLARTERKQCRGCGALHPAGARFCGRCGRGF